MREREEEEEEEEVEKDDEGREGLADGETYIKRGEREEG